MNIHKGVVTVKSQEVHVRLVRNVGPRDLGLKDIHLSIGGLAGEISTRINFTNKDTELVAVGTLLGKGNEDGIFRNGQRQKMKTCGDKTRSRQPKEVFLAKR